MKLYLLGIEPNGELGGRANVTGFSDKALQKEMKIQERLGRTCEFELEDNRRGAQTPRIEFVGYQKQPKGKPIAIFNVIGEGHPLHKSTVCCATLKQYNLAPSRHRRK